MDCDTTGVEPDIALVKYKLLAGGGMLKIVNRGVPDALRRLAMMLRPSPRSSRTSRSTTRLKTFRKNGATIQSGLKAEHLPVFDCAFKPHQGKRSIGYLAHLKMMGAAQPFISGRDFQGLSTCRTNAPLPRSAILMFRRGRWA